MRVMVPVEDLPYSFAALESLTQRQWPEEAKFVLVRVIESNQIHLDPTKVYNPEEHSKHLNLETDHHIKRATRWLEGLCDALTKQEHKVEPAILVGDISHSLVEFAVEWNADFIVMGSHDRTARERAWLSSIAATVAEKANCSVELVRPGKLHDMLLQEHVSLDDVAKIDFSPKRIVVPLDFSNNSLEAVNWLCKIKGLEKASIALVSVAKGQGSGIITDQLGKASSGAFAQPMDSEVMMKLNRQADFLRTNQTIYSLDQRVLNGEPVSSILEFAQQWQADLILASTRGETNGNNPIVGTTARGIMDHAHCSVAVIKPDMDPGFTFSWRKKKAMIC